VTPAASSAPPPLAAFASVVGAWALFREHRSAFWVLALPIVAALLASALGQYPFGRRLILFLVPTLLLFVAAGAERIHRAAEAGAPFVGPLLAAFLFLEPSASALRNLVSPSRYEDLRPVVRHLAERWREGDSLYLYYDAQFAFRYYAEREGLALRPDVVGSSSRAGGSRT